jgi:EAL domain-containing protein (putative c-di-GMP-specific phosphodiesterase class I)/GGDEF domain-containing protein
MRLYDPETGLPGRPLGIDRLAVATARCERTSTAVAVVMLDAGNVPAVRAARLAGVVRAGDSIIRPDEAHLAVIGDDLGDATEAEALAVRAAQALGAGVPVGLAVAEGPRDPEELLAEAGAALERAREHGGGPALYDEGARERARARARGEAELRGAIASGELVLHYQPIVDLDDGSLRGIEALVRWEHPEHGLLGPDEFVPVAEESGAIVPLGGWVLRDACRQAAAWHAHRPQAEPFFISVNVSARELVHPAIAGVVHRALTESGLDPSHLCLEVAETHLAADPMAAQTALQRLSGMGVLIAVDDASADWARHAMGIDVSYVKAGARNVPAVLAAADDDVIVIATGVEKRTQESGARRRGCHVAQGYLYARPAPPAEIEALLDVAPAPVAPAAA